MPSVTARANRIWNKVTGIPSRTIHRKKDVTLTCHVDGARRSLAAARIDAQPAGLGHRLQPRAGKLTVPPLDHHRATPLDHHHAAPPNLG
jgi:hypothetical protein